MRRPPLLAVAMLTLAPVLVACGDDDTSTDGRPADHMDGSTMHPGGSHRPDHDGPSDVAEGARRIEVRATSFEFDPAEITASVGEDIAIVLRSDDILHDFTIDELDAHVAAGRGQTEEGGFTAGEAGEYTFYCSVDGHREAGMEGTLVVEGS
jgi:plastocyanin